jgi:hypothetical protein
MLVRESRGDGCWPLNHENKGQREHAAWRRNKTKLPRVSNPSIGQSYTPVESANSLIVRLPEKYDQSRNSATNVTLRTGQTRSLQTDHRVCHFPLKQIITTPKGTVIAKQIFRTIQHHTFAVRSETAIASQWHDYFVVQRHHACDSDWIHDDSGTDSYAY